MLLLFFSLSTELKNGAMPLFLVIVYCDIVCIYFFFKKPYKVLITLSSSICNVYICQRC